MVQITGQITIKVKLIMMSRLTPKWDYKHLGKKFV